MRSLGTLPVITVNLVDILTFILKCLLLAGFASYSSSSRIVLTELSLLHYVGTLWILSGTA